MVFKAGVSPNPAGRPKGSGFKQSLFNKHIVPNADEIIEKTMQMVRDGNENLLRFVLERLLPRPQDVPAVFALDDKFTEESITRAAEGVIKLVAAGDLLPEEGKNLTEMLKAHKDSMMMQALMDKLTALQSKVDEMGSK